MRRKQIRSIEDYGKEIERLFDELTISQADGDTNKFEILRPLNEKKQSNRILYQLVIRKSGIHLKHLYTNQWT